MKNKIAIQASNNIEENKEIIKILESLGGKNRFLTEYTNKSYCYYIRENNLIDCSNINYCYKDLKDYKLYTLEEYKKEFVENREMKIIPPEGYEIDKEKSTFEKIVFKKIEEKLTYEKIANKLFYEKNHYFTNSNGNIMETSIGWVCPNASPTKHQLERLLAINKLMNVAYYLNDGWEPNWSDLNEYKYYFNYNNYINKIIISSWSVINNGNIYFKTEKLAQQALKILGEETIKLALGVI